MQLGGCHNVGKYRLGALSIRNLKYNAPKEIPLVFHNGSNYDYHLIRTELAKEFEGEFSCLRENKQKFIIFSVPVNNELYS